ncbi:Cilia- and flagella-associated protein 45 [Nowakowskiella sp. JEL0407]|nr:Cilia- and flagella-associated protein 45 [Nowakowskiella sp. JEL0407]
MLKKSQSHLAKDKKLITVITRDNIRTLRPHTQDVDKNQSSIAGDVTVGIAPGGCNIPTDVLQSGHSDKVDANNSNLQQQQQQRQTRRKAVGGGGSRIGDSVVVGEPERKKVLSEGRKSSHPMVLEITEFDKIHNSAVFLSKEELEKRNHEANAQRITLAEAAKNRKMRMEEFDHRRTANSKLSELDQEAKDKSNYLLAKAQLQLEEQEDEIKHLNELMLYAKCVAIRDLQVEEKKMIQQERKAEESRLDAMMEKERVNELKKLEERERQRIEELRRGASKIRHQIEERKEANLLQQERRDQETKGIMKAIKDMQEQDKAEKLSKIQLQKALMLEVARANQESTERKKIQKLKEEEEDKKVLQYLLDKEQREIENDKIQAAKKAEREKELARLRAAQQKMSDKQAQQDALRAQRAFEAYERDWRRKEKETAAKQAAQEKELREERLKQQKAREHAIAVEARKMKNEFFENLQRQKEIEEKQKAEARERAEKNKIYSSEIKAQITEKEAARRKSREEFFMEGVKLAKERMEKISKIDHIKERKIQELRNVHVPEKYCKEIERKTLTNKFESLVCPRQ